MHSIQTSFVSKLLEMEANPKTSFAGLSSVWVPKACISSTIMDKSSCSPLPTCLGNTALSGPLLFIPLPLVQPLTTTYLNCLVSHVLESRPSPTTALYMPRLMSNRKCSGETCAEHEDPSSSGVHFRHCKADGKFR